MILRFTTWIGSTSSLVVHTCAFGAALALGLLHVAAWDTVLLILTTAVSLEAIYLAIFIQITVNRQAASLKEVEVDVGEIQKDVDEIQKDVDAIEEDVDEIQKDVDEIQEDDETGETLEIKNQQLLEGISQQLQTLMQDVERVKRGGRSS